MANAWYVSENQYGQWPSIQKTKFFAGDVTGDFYVASNDAQQMQAFFVNSWGTWSGHTIRADWTFWKEALTTANPNNDLYPSVTIAPSTNVSQNFYGLLTGDFERGYVPGGGKSSGNQIRMEYGQPVGTGANQVLTLPVSAVNPFEAGAVSLILNFPADKLEVLDVEMAAATSVPLDYHVNGNELRIGWNSLSPVYLAAGENLLRIKVRVLADLTEGEELRFQVTGSALNEITDGSVTPVQVVLHMNGVVGAAWGIDPGATAAQLYFGNYPNPFVGKTTLRYVLPVAGDVTLEVRNMLGSIVKVLRNAEHQQAGEYQLLFDASTLAPGVYSATLRIQSAEGQLTRTIKIIRNH